MNIKTLLFLVFTCSLSWVSNAQYDGKGPIRSRFRPGLGWHYKGIRPPDTARVNRYDRLMVDIAYNTWVGDREVFSAKPSSIGFGLNFMFDKPINDKNTVSLGYGLQFKHAHIVHNESTSKNFDSSYFQLSKSFIGDKSSFNFNQVSIPVEIRLRNESWRHAKLHIGGTFGYAFSQNVRSTYKSKDGNLKVTDRRIPDFSPWQYGVHARFGIRNWAIVGGYSISKLFANSKSSQLNTIYMGVTISLF